MVYNAVRMSPIFTVFLSISLRGPTLVNRMPVVGKGCLFCGGFAFFLRTGRNGDSCAFDCFGIPTVLLRGLAMVCRDWALCMAAVEAVREAVDELD